MSDPVFNSPLGHRSDRGGPEGLSISMHEIDDRGMIDLRGDAGNAEFLAAAKKALGLALPLEPRSSAGKGDISVLWLSIDQWLICCERSTTAAVLAKLQKALGSIHSLAVDMSDARAIIRLEGDGCREVLMKGAPVDLTLHEYRKGTVRRLHYAEIAAMVHIVGEKPDVVDFYVFRSTANFAWDWLIATARSPAHITVFAEQPVPHV